MYATANFNEALPAILKHEGGFVDHPKDPGGATNKGITHKTLAAWRGEPVTKNDVYNITDEEVRAIYRAWYWNPVRADDLPGGLALSVFDFAVNAGVSRSIKTLQEAVGMDPRDRDGANGPMTLGATKEAVRARGELAILTTFRTLRMRHYRSLTRLWPTFGKGWTRRTDETYAASVAIAERFASRLSVLRVPSDDKVAIEDKDPDTVASTLGRFLTTLASAIKQWRTRK